MNIKLGSIFAKLPIEQISTTVRSHIGPLLRLMPDKRMRRVAEEIIMGILAGQTPVITEMARQSSKDEGETWAAAKRIYRWMENKRIKSQQLFASLYLIGQQVMAAETPAYLVVAVDPVNFEKPYAKAIEGVSVVHKATPPALDGFARLTHGYPAITATIVNTKVPVSSYANWFSYKTEDFISQNKEIQQAFEQTCRLYRGYKVRFVGDSGLDDHIVPMSFGRKCLRKSPNWDRNSFSASVTWSGLLKSTTSVWIAGKQKYSAIWLIVCPIRLLSRFCLPTPVKIVSTPFNSAGSRSASQVQCAIYGSWWPMTKP
jgi:hypothetical protein